MGVPQARQFCEYALGMDCVPTTGLGGRDRGVEVISMAPAFSELRL